MEVDWKDKQRQDGLIITSVIMTTIATIFVVLRCVSRFVLIRNPGPDDYLIIAALLLTIGYLIDIFILRNNHLGFPVTMLTLDNMINFIKATLAVQVMYYANIFCIKTSILFTYLRFAVTPTFRVLCYSTIALHAVFFFICFVVTLAQCKPLNKMWDLAGTVDGTCINTTAFFYFTSAFNIITDIWILALPLRTLHGINRPTRDKVALFLIFGVGTFAAVASVVRLHTIRTYTLATDPFREGILVNLWSVIEVTIAISCASVSALKPIFSGRQRRITRAAMSGDGRLIRYRVQE
ncbi:integral membrane protein [Bombardia bombarda]|uniref:Integral membrane protein n=1 Tax=Bombardia bombarda TaxID=252184 RepID=A0AA39XLU4_9PEZI|nr:integral membrane protein [Bombardia bombarda]